MPEEDSSELEGIIPLKTKLGPFQKFRVTKKLLEKFGEPGVNALENVDGRTSVEEIRSSTGMENDEILALMESLESDGVIELKTVFDLKKTGNR